MVVYDFFNFSSVYEKLLLNNLMSQPEERSEKKRWLFRSGQTICIEVL